MKIEIGLSTFRVKLDDKFKDDDKLTNLVKYQMSIDKTLAYRTVKTYFHQMVYIFLYRSIVLFLLSLVTMLPISINYSTNLFSVLSLTFLISSFIYCIKFFNLWHTVNLLTNMTYSFIEMEIDIEKNPD